MLGDLLAKLGGTSGSRMQGLAIGQVIDVDDPMGMGRVLLNLPVHPGNSTTAWAPVAAPMAGDDRGCWLMPELGDVALVGFLHDDPEQPYVLGFLWNGQDRPPSDHPRERMIRSLNGHTIRFIDEEPVAGAMGALVIEDAHGNVITLSNGKIAIKAVALLQIEAPSVTIGGPGWRRIVTPNSNPI
jgi:phage baseplate assembly protein gpV